MSTELRKLAGLPSVWVAVGLSWALPPVLAYLNMRAPGTGTDAGFLELTVGVIGPLVMGAVTAGSEYRGRQITTSLTCVPNRSRFLAGQAAALASAVAVVALLSAVATLAVVGGLSAAAVPRIVGLAVYWVLNALIAYGVVLIVRSGVVPLTIMIVNSSAVSVTYLLTMVTPWATLLPDLAGAHLYIEETNAPMHLTPVTGGLVMAGWTAAVLGAAAYVFQRRDA